MFKKNHRYIFHLQRCRVNLSLLPIFDNLTTKISFHNFYFDEIISNINKIHENMYQTNSDETTMYWNDM